MTYDLKPIRAPRLAGTPLRLLANLAARPIAGAAVRAQMVHQLGIERFRRIAADCAPLFEPLLPVPDEAMLVLPTSELVREAARAEPCGPGFRYLSAADYVSSYEQGERTPVDVAQAVLLRIDESDRPNPPLRAFIAHDPQDLLAQAEQSALRYRERRPLGPLDGVPVAIKDEVDQEGYPTTVGTRFLGRDKARQDATTVARLRAAGALLIGKTNMHELGAGVTGLNPHHGAPRNPYADAHATGGSSSGSAAAVAAGICPVALGADGGGSVRIPAALCGLVGLKPTYGRVSEHGAAPLCWSVAHIGPLAATARDAAIGYLTMAGPDPLDPHSTRQPPPDLDGFADRDLRGVTLGIYRPWFEDADPAIVTACHRVLEGLQEAGATVREVVIEDLETVRIAHLITIAVEMATSQQLWFDRHAADYGLDVRLNLLLARHLPSTDYVHAQRHRARIVERLLSVLTEVDAICSPTTACTAPPLPKDALQTGESNLELLGRIMRYAPAANLSGLPAISFPAGYDAFGLPIGFQAMGRPWRESLLLRLAHVAEGFVERKKPQRYHAPF